MRLLALDISSVAVGVCVLDDGDVTTCTSYAFVGDLQRRLVGIGDLMAQLVKLQPDYLAIEAPAFSRFEHVALQRAAGAMLCQWRGGKVIEVSPTAAKKALTGDGKADKAHMVRAARWFCPGREMNDHAADALAVGLAALGVIKQEMYT